MPRYDRIGPLASPQRENVFAGWMTLRDLENRDRDPDLLDRARLRFLAIRPVRRLLERGVDNVPLESFDRQIEGIREELGHLRARDPERIRLSQYLHRIRQRTPIALVTAAIDVGDIAEASGHFHGATEFYQTALEIADRYGLPAERILALRLLGRVARKEADWEKAEKYYRRAAQLALELADRQQWARAMDGLGIAFRSQGAYPKARSIFQEVLTRGREWQDPTIIALAASSLSVNELTAGDYDAALDFGWQAASLFDDEEEKHPVIGNLASIFVQLGMLEAAEHCFEIVMERSQQFILRWQAAVGHAVIAARRGEAKEFRSRRDAVLAAQTEWNSAPLLLAHTHTELARGAMMVGDTQAARAHLKTGLAAAEKHHCSELVIEAEQLAALLKAKAAPAVEPATAKGSDVAERVAGQVRYYHDLLVGSTA